MKVMKTIKPFKIIKILKTIKTTKNIKPVKPAKTIETVSTTKTKTATWHSRTPRWAIGCRPTEIATANRYGLKFTTTMLEAHINSTAKRRHEEAQEAARAG